MLNKVDLVHARPDEVAEEIENSSIGIDATDALPVSAKTGVGVKEVLDAVIERIPAPDGDPEAPLQALIFDAVYDEFRGIIVYLRVVAGSINKRRQDRDDGLGQGLRGGRAGRFRPKMTKTGVLSAGEVGYFISNIKRSVT